MAMVAVLIVFIAVPAALGYASTFGWWHDAVGRAETNHRLAEELFDPIR